MSGPFYLSACGAVGSGYTDDTAAIDAALAAATNAGGGFVSGDPGKIYLTRGGHVLPKQVWFTDTTLLHSGNNSCLTYDGEDVAHSWSDDTVRGGILRCRIWGNSGSAAAGIEVRNSQHFRIQDTIVGDLLVSSKQYTNGVGLLVHNSAYWNENLQLDNFDCAKNATGIQYLRDGTGTQSLEYHRYRGVSLSVPANGVGMDIAPSGSTFLFTQGMLDINVWLTGNNAIGVRLAAGSTFDSTNWAFIRGESFHNTGCISLENSGNFSPKGIFEFPYGNPGATVVSNPGATTILNGSRVG